MVGGEEARSSTRSVLLDRPGSKFRCGRRQDGRPGEIRFTRFRRIPAPASSKYVGSRRETRFTDDKQVFLVNRLLTKVFLINIIIKLLFFLTSLLKIFTSKHVFYYLASNILRIFRNTTLEKENGSRQHLKNIHRITLDNYRNAKFKEHNIIDPLKNKTGECFFDFFILAALLYILKV